MGLVHSGKHNSGGSVNPDTSEKLSNPEDEGVVTETGSKGAEPNSQAA